MTNAILKLEQVREIGNTTVSEIVGVLNTEVWHGLIEMVTCEKGRERENKPYTYLQEVVSEKERKTDTKAMRQMYDWHVLEL